MDIKRNNSVPNQLWGALCHLAIHRLGVLSARGFRSNDIGGYYDVRWVNRNRPAYSHLNIRQVQRRQHFLTSSIGILIDRKCILGSIETHRQGLISELCEQLYDLVERLWNEPPSKTTAECHSTFLGSLLKQIRANGLPCERPVKPFEGLSAAKYSEMVSSIYTPRSCSTNSMFGVHLCRLGQEVRYQVKELMRNAKGLQLDMFGYNIIQKELPSTMLIPLFRIDE
jgi:hypothetical protein